MALHGYRTETAESAEAVLRLPDLESFACVICDVRMPGMSGLELAQALRRRFPHLRLLLVSACDMTSAENAIAASIGAPLMLKPVTSATLATFCRETGAVPEPMA
jgi:CheY-like chemotaxis protein